MDILIRLHYIVGCYLIIIIKDDRASGDKPGACFSQAKLYLNHEQEKRGRYEEK